jgi:hypothetical protein
MVDGLANCDLHVRPSGGFELFVCLSKRFPGVKLGIRLGPFSDVLGVEPDQQDFGDEAEQVAASGIWQRSRLAFSQQGRPFDEPVLAGRATVYRVRSHLDVVSVGS